MAHIDDVDLAKVGPCPGCGAPVRRLSVPIRGNGLDAQPADGAWCADCLAYRCDLALEPVAARLAAQATARLGVRGG